MTDSNSPATDSGHAKGIRLHDLDALRAAAMSLGLVLHAMMSFIEIPIWPAQDINQNSEVYGFVLHAIHGFRMPLFFLISGFFTALLWRRRGMAALLKNRLIRIVVPMAIGVVIFWPMMIAIGIWGGIHKAQLAKDRSPEAVREGLTLWTAAKNGDIEAIRKALDSGAAPSRRDGIGITPLGWAALSGETEAVDVLLDAGANIDATNQDGSTPLHAAAFLGRADIVELLLEKGADPLIRNHKSETPLDSARSNLGAVDWIAGALQIETDRQTAAEGRKEVIALLKQEGLETGEPEKRKASFSILKGIWTAGSLFPVFHHLWFLYYLCLFAAVFAVIAPITSKLPWGISTPLAHPVGRWFWVLPLTLFAQWNMTQSFGPDTATGILPWPPKFLYYATFFGFGAVCYGNPIFEQRAGKFWPLNFALAIPILLGALHFHEMGGARHSISHLAYTLLAVLYAWLMIFGWIGFFRRFFSSEDHRIRYLSDSAYWLYLAHLPIMMGLQILVSGWDLPSWVKFLGILAFTTGFLLLIYDWCIRYTWIGAILNGRKYRHKDHAR